MLRSYTTENESTPSGQSEAGIWLCPVRVWETDHGARTAEMRLLRRRAVAAELPDPGAVARFRTVVHDHVIVAAVVVPLHVELLELQLYDLLRQQGK